MKVKKTVKVTVKSHKAVTDTSVASTMCSSNGCNSSCNRCSVGKEK